MFMNVNEIIKYIFFYIFTIIDGIIIIDIF